MAGHGGVVVLGCNQVKAWSTDDSAVISEERYQADDEVDKQVNIHPYHRAAWLRAQPVTSAKVARSRRAGNQLRVDYCEPARHDHLSCPRCRPLPRVAPRVLPAMRRWRSCGSNWRRGTPRS